MIQTWQMHIEWYKLGSYYRMYLTQYHCLAQILYLHSKALNFEM